MILLLSALAMLTQTPQAEPRLNYTAPAFPIQRICADLSKQAGVKLRVTDDLASEPLVVRFKDVPLTEALDKIALAVRAEWGQGQGGDPPHKDPAAAAEAGGGRVRAQACTGARRNRGDSEAAF